MAKNKVSSDTATHADTEFMAWWALALAEFRFREMPDPTFGPARDAYAAGESPATWAEYVKNT